MSPFTSSLYPGTVIPIPTLPVCVNKKSAPEFASWLLNIVPVARSLISAAPVPEYLLSAT